MESLFIFLFSLLLSSQLGKHFFLSFSYLSGIRIDYLAPTLYLTDILSLVCIYYFMLQCVIPVKTGIQTIIFQFKRGNLRLVIPLIFLLIINYFFALSKPLWFYSGLRILQWICIFIYFKNKAKNKSFFSALLLGAFLGGVVELILSLSQLASRQSIQGWWYYAGERAFSILTLGIAKAYFLGHEFLRPYGTFSHPNSLAGFYLLLYAVVLVHPRITNMLFKTILLSVFSFLIFVSFSRSAIAVYVVLNSIYLVKNSLHCKLCILAKVIISCLLLFFAWNISGDSKGMQKRFDFSEKAVAIIKEKPLSGVGLGSYLIAQHSYPQKFSTFFEQPVHNIYLLTVAQLGVPLSLLFLILISRFLSPKFIFLFPLLVVLLTGCMDHYWLTLQQNVLLTAVVFGMISSYETKTS